MVQKLDKSSCATKHVILFVFFIIIYNLYVYIYNIISFLSWQLTMKRFSQDLLPSLCFFLYSIDEWKAVRTPWEATASFPRCCMHAIGAHERERERRTHTEMQKGIWHISSQPLTHMPCHLSYCKPKIYYTVRYDTYRYNIVYLLHLLH